MAEGSRPAPLTAATAKTCASKYCLFPEVQIGDVMEKTQGKGQPRGRGVIRGEEVM